MVIISVCLKINLLKNALNYVTKSHDVKDLNMGGHTEDVVMVDPAIVNSRLPRILGAVMVVIGISIFINKAIGRNRNNAYITPFIKK